MTPYLSQTELDAIASDPSTISAYYIAYRTDFIGRLGSGLSGVSEEGRKLCFASIVAHDLKPYGQSTSTQLTDLLNDNSLDCDNYIYLTWWLFKEMVASPALTVNMVGWNDGAVGNHAQIFAHGAGSWPFLVDPTVAMIAQTTWRRVMTKDTVTMFADFYWRTELTTFKNTVVSALQNGLYWPEDLMYFAKSPEQYINDLRGHRDLWATPQA